LMFDRVIAFYSVNFDQSFLHVLVYKQFKQAFFFSQLLHQQVAKTLEELVALEFIQHFDPFGFLVESFMVDSVAFEKVSQVVLINREFFGLFKFNKLDLIFNFLFFYLNLFLPSFSGLQKCSASFEFRVLILFLC